jgi:hypothetical protein
MAAFDEAYKGREHDAAYVNLAAKVRKLCADELAWVGSGTGLHLTALCPILGIVSDYDRARVGDYTIRICPKCVDLLRDDPKCQVHRHAVRPMSPWRTC